MVGIEGAVIPCRGARLFVGVGAPLARALARTVPCQEPVIGRGRMATTPYAHDSKERHEGKPANAPGSRRRRRTAAAAVLAIMVGGLYAPQIVNAPPASAFGTVN